MPVFSVVIATAVPSSLGAEGSGAFVKVDGRESLLRAADLFFNRDEIEQIQLVVASDKFEEAKRKFGDHLSFAGAKLMSGPAQWIDQLAAAGEKISSEATHVIVHDAARPAVAYTDLDQLLAEVEKHPIAFMTTPVRGGIIEIEESGKPVSIRSSQNFQNIVTPWAMRKDKFMDMVKSRREPPANEIWLVRSSSLNIRVVSASDATLAKAALAMLPKPKVRGPDNPFEEAQW
jgi:2-C-methyl-D-erythritol 4-phosphate cytidylyltransferase